MDLAEKIQDLVAFSLSKFESDENMQASMDALILQAVKEAIAEELASPETAKKIKEMVKKKLTDKHITDAVGAAFSRKGES